MNINLPAPKVMGDDFKFDASKWNTGSVTSGLDRYGNYQQPKKKAAPKKVAPAPAPKPKPKPKANQDHKVYAGGTPDFDERTGKYTDGREQPSSTPSQPGGSDSGLIGSALKAPEPVKAKAHTYSAATYDPSTYEAENYDAKTGKAATYNADQREVKDNATVKYQLQQLLDENGRYMQSARTRAAEASNARGLLNSSMAAGAGERAAIDSAMPIATQDANTFNTRALANMDAENTSRRFNAGNEQQMGLANMDAINTSRQFNTSANNRAGEFNASAKNQAGQFNAGSKNQARASNTQAKNQASQFNTSQENSMAQDQWTQETARAHDETMANLDAELEKGIIDQKAYANMRGQYLDSVSKIMNDSTVNISQIQTSTTIPAEEKEKMIENEIDMRDANMVVMEKITQSQPMWQKNWSDLDSGGDNVVRDMVAEQRAREEQAANA